MTIEEFELDAARRTWEALTDDAKHKLRWLLEAKCVMLNSVEVDDPNGSISVLGEIERNALGMIKRDKHGYAIQKVVKRMRHAYTVTADWQKLIDMGLVIYGTETTMNWGVNGGPPAYHLSNFGQQVARYGTAATIVELANRAVGAS